MTTSATLHVMNMQSEIIYKTRSHYILRRHVRSTWNSSQVFSKLDRFAHARYSWLCAFKVTSNIIIVPRFVVVLCWRTIRQYLLSLILSMTVCRMLSIFVIVVVVTTASIPMAIIWSRLLGTELSVPTLIVLTPLFLICSLGWRTSSDELLPRITTNTLAQAKRIKNVFSRSYRCFVF